MAIDEPRPTIQLNSHLHERYREIKYLGIRAERELKKYKKAYEPIESKFRHYDEELKKMWDLSKADYDKSIFIMMPFVDNQNFRSLAQKIKNTCEKYKFKAFRIDDPFRSPCRGLWENIELNMLACKFGIAVHVAETVWDRMEDKPKFSQNPNVAVEFGFMQARGKEVVILKDENTELPSDMNGFIWKSFDINNSDKTVEAALSQ